MSTKQIQYEALFQKAWDRYVVGVGVSIRLASINDLGTFRTYLSRWKTIKKIEWPDKLGELNLFRAELRKDETGYLLDFRPPAIDSAGTTLLEEPPPPPPPPPKTADLAPVKEGQIHPASPALANVDMSQMARRKDWVRILGLRGYHLQEFLANPHASSTWLEHGPDTATGVSLLDEHFPIRTEASGG